MDRHGKLQPKLTSTQTSRNPQGNAANYPKSEYASHFNILSSVHAGKDHKSRGASQRDSAKSVKHKKAASQNVEQVWTSESLAENV